MKLLRRRSDTPFALTNVNLIDPRDGNTTSGVTVVVKGSRISEVSRTPGLAPSTETFDGAGAFICPGLIDGHVHVNAVSEYFGGVAPLPRSYVAAHASHRMRQMLSNGFTTVRDAAGADFGLARAVDEELFVAPRLFFGGKALSQTGGHADFRVAGVETDPGGCCGSPGVICDGVGEVRKAARDQLRTGADHIKVMLSGGASSPTDRVDSTQFAYDEIVAAVEEATAFNRYVAGHAYTARAINRGLRAGVRSIEHGAFADEDSIKLFLENDAFLVPTLATHKFTVEEGEKYGLSEDMLAKEDGLYEAALDATRRAHQAGVKVVFGTDLLGRMNEHQSKEFSLRSKVMDPLAILQSATTIAAELLDSSQDLGVVAEGYLADCLLLKSNPLDDVAAVGEPAEYLTHIVANGRLFAA